MSVEGFWIVRVENSDMGESTGATMTLRKGHVTGGDDTYYYLGTYSEDPDDGGLTLTIDAIRYTGDPLPDLEDLSEMVFLEMTLTPSSREDHWHGAVVDRVGEDAAPLRAEARRVAVLP